MQFNSDSIPKTLKPEMYPEGQRLLVNSQLLYSLQDSNENFDDDDSASSDLLLPKDLIQNLPSYSKNFYDIEYLDVKESYDIRQAKNEYDPDFDVTWEDIKNQE